MKEIFHRCEQNEVQKKLLRYRDDVKKKLPLKLQILQIFTAKFNAFIKLTGNIIEVSNRWRSEKKDVDMQEKRGSNPCPVVYFL